MANPNVEISAYKDETWLRTSTELMFDENKEVKKAMLNDYPELRSIYDENDDNTKVFYFKTLNQFFPLSLVLV